MDAGQGFVTVWQYMECDFMQNDIKWVWLYCTRPCTRPAHDCTAHGPFHGPFSGTTQVSQYQKSKTNLDFIEARDSEWKWHQLGHTQVCTSLQTDNHASTSPFSFLQARMAFLAPNQQHQSIEGTDCTAVKHITRSLNDDRNYDEKMSHNFTCHAAGCSRCWRLSFTFKSRQSCIRQSIIISCSSSIATLIRGTSCQLLLHSLLHFMHRLADILRNLIRWQLTVF